eukprot:2993883-Rhodomonas_salina.1
MLRVQPERERAKHTRAERASEGGREGERAGRECVCARTIARLTSQRAFTSASIASACPLNAAMNTGVAPSVWGGGRG